MDLPMNITEYTQLLKQIKQRVQLAQKRAIFSASAGMLRMYWDIGGMLQSYNDEAKWGDKVLERLSVDLKNEYPSIKGFTSRNCRYMMQFYREYNKELTFVKRPVSQIECDTKIEKPSVLQFQNMNLVRHCQNNCVLPCPPSRKLKIS